MVNSPAGSNPPTPIAQRSYRFRSADNKWCVDLDQGLLALTCFDYPEWAIFRARFDAILAKLIDIYQVRLITRIGLRYKDIISKGPLGLGNRSWRELIKPGVFGTIDFFTDGLDRNPQMDFSVFLTIPPGKVRIGVTSVMNPEREAGILIDTDCYSEESSAASVKDVMDRADKLHDYTSTVFQACITDLLHESLQGRSEAGRE